MNHPILIECVEEERPDSLLCTVAGKAVWIPKAAIRRHTESTADDGTPVICVRTPQLGECDVKAEIPLDLARQLGLVKAPDATFPSIAFCRSCGARMAWLKTAYDKNIPLDPEPVEYGGNIVVRNGVAVVLVKNEPSEAGEKRYRSHFATCPAANDHRKPASTDAAKTKAGKRAKPPAPKEEPNLFGEE